MALMMWQSQAGLYIGHSLARAPTYCSDQGFEGARGSEACAAKIRTFYAALTLWSLLYGSCFG